MASESFDRHRWIFTTDLWFSPTLSWNSNCSLSKAVSVCVLKKPPLPSSAIPDLQARSHTLCNLYMYCILLLMFIKKHHRLIIMSDLVIVDKFYIFKFLHLIVCFYLVLMNKCTKIFETIGHHFMVWFMSVTLMNVNL